MNDVQREAAEIIIDAIHDCENPDSPERMHRELAEFFERNPVPDRRDFLEGLKLIAIWESNPDIDQAGPTVGVMDDGWQSWAKEAAIESWGNGDYGDSANREIEEFEKEIEGADLSGGRVFNGPLGFSISIEPTNALALLSGMGGDFPWPEGEEGTAPGTA